MDNNIINLAVKPQFDAVFLVNGKLFEGGEIEYGLNNVVYITVFPLDALLLPYTVMLVGGTVKCNNKLASCYKLGEDRYHLALKPRHNYVYSVESSETQPKSVAEKFFRLLKQKKAAPARELITEELSSSVDDAALLSFFDGFKDIIDGGSSGSKGLFYLIADSDEGKPYNFIVKDSQIDNIVEL